MGQAQYARTVADIRRARHRAGLTQGSVDTLCNLRPGTTGSLENRNARLGGPQLVRILETVRKFGVGREAQTVGEKLTRARKEAEVPRWRLSRETGVPQKEIEAIEIGRVARPKAGVLEALFAGLSRAAPAWEAPDEPEQPRAGSTPKVAPETRKALKRARLNAGLSRVQVAGPCGLAPNVLREIELGPRGADAAAIERIFAVIRENAQPDPATLGGKLWRARYAAEIPQYRLAFMSGVGLETIRDIENGRTLRPKQATLRSLFGVMGVPVPEWSAPAGSPGPGRRPAGEYVGLRLAFARAAAGITLGECAGRIGKSADCIRQLETDVFTAAPEVMEGLTGLLWSHGFPRLAPEQAAARLGRHVMERREALGISRRGLAGLADATVDYVRAAETGGGEPSRDLALVLGKLGRVLRREEELTPSWGPATPTDGTTLLRAARLRAGFSPAALAERAAVSRQTVLRIESGEATPKAGTWSRLRAVLTELEGVPVPEAEIPAGESPRRRPRREAGILAVCDPRA